MAIVQTNVPWSSALLAKTLHELRRQYPFLQLSVIGRSVLGRPIFMVTIGCGALRVGYNAAHHANEWITTPLLMKFLEEYAAAAANESLLAGVDCRALYRSCTLDLVPMVNPDGVDLVTGAFPENSKVYAHAQLIAADFPEIPFPSGWKANIQGIDLNLQYPAAWTRAREIKFAQGYSGPAPRDFVGPEPLAAPEAYAMYWRALQAEYQLILAYHTQGQLIYWKFDDYTPEGSQELANRMQAVSGYLPQETPVGSGSAGYKDWFIQQFNRPGYTIEAGQGTNPLPLTQFDAIYRDNLGILMLGLLHAEGQSD
jgi:g-D-glutamyl-meso-diaminopimelate peptidase